MLMTVNGKERNVKDCFIVLTAKDTYCIFVAYLDEQHALNFEELVTYERFTTPESALEYCKPIQDLLYKEQFCNCEFTFPGVLIQKTSNLKYFVQADDGHIVTMPV